MNEFWDVSVIVEGALDASETFESSDGMEDYIARQEQAAKKDGLWTEVFVQYHGHPMAEEECACAQYETDHHPDYEWNVR